MSSPAASEKGPLSGTSQSRLVLGLALTFGLVALLVWLPVLGILGVLAVGVWLTFRLSLRPRRVPMRWDPQQILEAIPTQVWLLDRAGRPVAQNRLASQQGDSKTAPSMDWPNQLAVSTESAMPNWHQETMRVIQTGEPLLDRLERITTFDGKERWLSVSKIPIRNEGEISGVVLTITDRTAEAVANDALRHREAEAQRLALVASRTDNLVIITDAEGRIEWVNDAFTTMSGWKLEECRGRKPGHLLQGADTDRQTVEYMSDCIRRGDGFNVEILNYHRCGRPYWLDLNVQAIRDSQGKLTNFIAIERDITEKKRAEQELRERVILASLTAEVGVALTAGSSQRSMLQDCVHAIVKHLDAAFARIWTLSPSSNMLELQASAGIYTHLDGPHSRIPMGMYKIGKIAATRTPILTNDLQNDPRVSDPDWARREGIIGFAGQPLLVDGRLVGVMALFSRHPLAGVTLSALAGVADAIALGLERKRIEAERDQFFMLSPDPIVVADLQGICWSVNPAYERLTGYSQTEIQGRSLFEHVLDEDKPAVYEAMRLLLADTKPVFVEFRKTTHTGKIVWTSWAAIRAEEQNVIYAIGRDITSTKRHEEEMARAKEVAESANIAKSTFLSRMSHELRTPLNAILGFAQLMETSLLADGQRESIEQILIGGRHLLRLINDVLDLSRVESGNLALELAPLELAPAIQETIDLIRPLALTRQVEIELEPCSGSAWVLADRRRFAQALLNLLSNAVKYNREQGRVWVRSRTGISGWRIEVQDQGPGLSEQQIPLLFRPFERLGAERSTTEGTGLGLALARTLIEAMNGRIGAECEVDQGCIFWIELPSSPVMALGPSVRPGSYQGVKPWMGEGTVLQIEDNPTNSQLVELILSQREGLTLINASSGTAGLDLALRCLPSLILLDVQLPDLDGHEVLNRLKANPLTASIPVIVLSADATAPTIERLRAAGAVAYLTKPLEIHRLLAVVDTYLQSTMANTHG